MAVHESFNSYVAQVAEVSVAADTVPQAVIRFRQGFGRLIRSSDDTGAVTLLERLETVVAEPQPMEVTT